MSVGQSSAHFAAIDLGSNSCRLLVMQETPEGLRVVDAFSRVVRLSEGLTHTGELCDKACLRALEVLEDCARKLSIYTNVTLRCVATEACRKASNAKEFLEKVKTRVGFDFVVISQEEEATLAVKGIAGLLDPTFPYALVFDVGGASTEVVLVKQNIQPSQARILDWISLPLGVVSIAEAASPENATSYLRITQQIKRVLQTFGEPHNLDLLIQKGLVQLVGSSGTATTAAALHLGLRYYARHRVDGVVLSFTEVENVIKSLQMMSIDERNRHPCIGPERSDLVLAGMAVFEGLASAWPVGQVTVADRGVRDGIVHQLYETKYAKVRPSIYSVA
ncbi:MAG: Ppx/GppA family phosphatase [Alphaproteobacteria bacterium]|jgi:exopolyphosphatase/guanosine-5'-triphosphate,3'-diphosphate pyrophosphatase